MSSEERILFKDKITRKEYAVLAKELLNAIDMGEDALKKVLIGCENPELYSSHGTYQEGGHNRCGGLKGSRFTEKRFCKCLYYRNGKYAKAISFFEETKQNAEFEKAIPEIKELLAKADITVFRFEKTGEKAYKICRL